MIPIGSSYVVSGALSPVLTNLVAWYKFDEGSAQVLTDYSGNGNHGQLGSTADVDTNDPAWVTSPDNGLDFVTDDKVVLPSRVFTGAFTVQILFVADDNTTRALLGKAAATNRDTIAFNATAFYSIRVGNTGDVDVTIAGPAQGTAQVVTLRRNSANKVDLFQDNGNANRIFADAAIAGTTTYDQLGVLGAATNFFDGRMFAALFYSGELTDAEIQSQNYAYLKALKPGLTLP